MKRDWWFGFVAPLLTVVLPLATIGLSIWLLVLCITAFTLGDPHGWLVIFVPVLWVCAVGEFILMEQLSKP